MKYIIINNPIINIVHLYMAIILIGVSACKNDKPTICSSENTLRIPKDILDRFIFKDSTYWIYQDSASMQIDSVWVYKNQYSIINQDVENTLSKGKCFEYFLTYFSSKLNNTYEINLNCANSAFGTPIEQEIFDILYYKNKLVVDGFSMRGNKYIAIDTTDHKVFQVDSIKVNDITYKNIVLHVNISGGAFFYSESYYAPNVGLIKYRLRNGSVWNLIRKNIKQ